MIGKKEEKNWKQNEKIKWLYGWILPDFQTTPTYFIITLDILRMYSNHMRWVINEGGNLEKNKNQVCKTSDNLL